MSYLPKIICLTEESVETLHLLNKQSLISGVSSFVKRPEQAKNHAKVSLFTSSNYKKINELAPDLIIGHSDIQKDIARDLIELGHNVFIANHRTLKGILDYITILGRIVDASEQAELLVQRLESKIDRAKEAGSKLKKRPRVYFEEWDDPMISSIDWVSELIELCGGEDINSHTRGKILAKDRLTTNDEIIDKNPDIIFGCWCGKKVRVEQIKSRDGYNEIEAVKNDQVFELAPEIFLQPGPAPFIDGIDILIKYFNDWNQGEYK